MAKQKIVAIEDEPDILELVRFALTQEGFTVTTAATGQEALDALKGSRPDAVVLVVTIRALKMHGGKSKDDLIAPDVAAASSW